jgi:uncharacterized protein (UPF0335 family)
MQQNDLTNLSDGGYLHYNLHHQNRVSRTLSDRFRQGKTMYKYNKYQWYSQELVDIAIKQDKGIFNMNKDLLLSIVQRIEKLNEDAAQIAADIKEIYKEALAQGYDPKYIKKCIALRKKDQDEIDEEDELMKMYREALGL